MINPPKLAEKVWFLSKTDIVSQIINGLPRELYISSDMLFASSKYFDLNKVLFQQMTSVVCIRVK